MSVDDHCLLWLLLGDEAVVVDVIQQQTMSGIEEAQDGGEQDVSEKVCVVRVTLYDASRGTAQQSTRTQSPAIRGHNRDARSNTTGQPLTQPTSSI